MAPFLIAGVMFQYHADGRETVYFGRAPHGEGRQRDVLCGDHWRRKSSEFYCRSL